jgi:glycosyltransferase involved in cell wall biosynthesis
LAGNAKKVLVIPNGIDVRRFRPQPAKLSPEEEALIGKRKIVFFHANLLFQPNIAALEVLRRASYTVLRDRPNICFLIAGGPIPKHPPQDSLLYVGKVENVVNYINRSDVCVLPYPVHLAPSGTKLKLLEYLACAKPTVSTM